LYVSTDEVYGETFITDNNLRKENDNLNPTTPYSATKLSAEHLCTSYYKSFKIPIIITRSNNVYGPKQYPEKIISRSICMLLQDKPMTIHGNGENYRSYIYISDVINAFDLIIHKGQINNIYNIGSNTILTNNEIVRLIMKLLNIFDEKKYMKYIENRIYNDSGYLIDNTKLISLGWKSKINIYKGLNLTINWYKKNINHWN